MAGVAASCPIGERFAGLEGRWRLERRSSNGPHFSGEAVFSRSDDAGYLLREEGSLRLADGEVLSARREWLWHLTDTGEIEIRYPPDAGGGLYHRFRPFEQNDFWTGEADHLCGRDVYRATYRLGEDELVIFHTVKGPAKDYQLDARYLRVTDSGRHG